MREGFETLLGLDGKTRGIKEDKKAKKWTDHIHPEDRYQQQLHRCAPHAFANDGALAAATGHCMCFSLHLIQYFS